MEKLFLVIAEPWFSMIRDGKKKEEYREIKDYYRSRLFDGWNRVKANGIDYYNREFEKYPLFKCFDLLVLRNGYRADSQTITLKNPKIRIGTGRPEWGAVPGVNYFVITWEK